MSAYVMDEDLFAQLETVEGLASLQAWIFEEVELPGLPGGRGIPGVEISALGQAMHHLLRHVRAGATLRFDVDPGAAAAVSAEVAHG